MQVKDLVSVIVPAYNAEKTIVECVKSILQQTYKQIEIIVVDDGSTDHTLEILKKEKFDITILSKENGGASSARNYGLLYCKGEFIQFVDSDDCIEVNMVEKLISILQETNSDLAICGYRYYGTTKEFSPEKHTYSGDAEIKRSFLELWRTTFINVPWNKIYRFSILDGLRFNDNLIVGEDLTFNIDYLKRCKKITCIQEPLYLYRYSYNDSLTQKYYPSCFTDLISIYNSVLGYLDNNYYLENIKLISSILWDTYEHCVYILFRKSKKNKEQIVKELNKWQDSELMKIISNNIDLSRKRKIFLGKSYFKIQFEICKLECKQNIKKIIKDIIYKE